MLSQSVPQLTAALLWLAGVIVNADDLPYGARINGQQYPDVSASAALER